jgi:hypothetical protein
MSETNSQPLTIGVSNEVKEMQQSGSREVHGRALRMRLSRPDGAPAVTLAVRFIYQARNAADEEGMLFVSIDNEH